MDPFFVSYPIYVSTSQDKLSPICNNHMLYVAIGSRSVTSKRQRNSEVFSASLKNF